jgi:hypothetical protein
MGIRSAFYRLLASGAEPNDVGDEHVELGVLSQIEGPLVLARLLDNGIDARATEAFDVVMRRPGGLRITVPRRSLEDAARLWGAEGR